MKKRILFVDDEHNVLQGLRRMLRVLNGEWDMSFAQSGREALDLLMQANYDVIVTDVRMPGMAGDELLDKVMRQYPHIVRIVLSGHSDMNTIVRSIGLAHQCLSKPCSAELLKSTIARACALRKILDNSDLKNLINQMKSLPSLPDLYVDIVNALRSPNVSVNRVGRIISRDAGMSTKILQLVNSAYFGIRRNITDPVQATIYLGIDTIEALVFSVGVFQKFSRTIFPGFSLHDVWHHSLAISAFAKMITSIEVNDKKFENEAFIAGVLHDAGKLIFAANIPQRYSEALQLSRNKSIPLHEVEREMFSATHAEVGAYLLGLWGLPDPIVEALAFHHYPNQCVGDKFSPLTAVYVANVFSHEKERTGKNEGNKLYQLDFDYLQQFGLADRVEVWRKQCNSINLENV